VFYTEQFCQHLAQERRLSEHTLVAYTSDLAHFTAFIANTYSLTSILEVGHLHIRAWVASMIEAGITARTVNRRLSCLKTYYHYLKKRQIITTDPLRKVVAPRAAKRLPVMLQEREVAQLFSQVQFPGGYEGLLHRTILEVLYGTGLRRSELTNLRVEHIDFGRQVIQVLGKGAKTRLAPMPRYLAALLEGFLVARAELGAADSGPLLLNPKHARPLSSGQVFTIVRRYLSYVTNVEQRSPHVLRHSFASHLSNRGADLNSIKELLGHSSLAATQVYMHNTIKRLQDVYQQAHPKAEEDNEDKEV
jgi:integrase/recombinase XerC